MILFVFCEIWNFHAWNLFCLLSLQRKGFEYLHIFYNKLQTTATFPPPIEKIQKYDKSVDRTQ